MKKNWKIWIVGLILLPCMFFISGCSCSSNSNTNTTNKSNVTYTVIFYTGIASTFNIGNQEVKDGELVREPNISKYYYDDSTGQQYRLNGWYTDVSFDTEYLWKFPTDEVHSNLTLYAKWELRN